jgi:hypothetical protein
VKDEVVKMISSLLDTVTVSDIKEKLYFRARVDAAFSDLDKRDCIDQEEVERRMAKWLSE